MTKYYELRRRNKDEIGSLYSLNTSGDISQLNEIKKSIENESLPKESEILMEIDAKTGTGKKRLGDLVYWQKGRPNAHVLIVSNRLMEFIKMLNLPAFRVYKIRTQHLDVGEYFIFHLLGDTFDLIDYSEQIFFKKNVMNDVNEGYFEKGAFLNKNDFIQRRSLLVSEKSQTLSFDTIVYRREFDLLWGFSTLILVNELTRKKMEDQSFVLDFIEFNTYKIMYSKVIP
ncbi:hypothetical protein [Ohtaekwangia koreensis]|uniref:Uncharacterized protein n=1 Tax=Ohtaekwangia koreensis TaxID=688867 RepID=A0A1T5M7Z2_9BACT|nr:hypothetical protein [Ohtaekwangia koreensis]SKC84357.1 hypothetical protein SAMN05660236_4754 [Ohtaekwangia koreensis]